MSETSNEVAVRTGGGALAVGSDQTAWTDQQLAVLRSAGVSEEVTRAELDAFLHECQRTKLDPFSKQIYLIGRYDNQLKRKVFRSQTGIDGYRVVAHRVAREDRAELEYEDTLWCGPDGAWRDVWLAQQPPAAAKVVVYKGGKRYSAVATLEEYAARYPDGNPYPMWRRMPANQLEKCAEAKALRRAFPNDLGGIYTAEEMEQADARDERPAAQELTVEQAAAKMRRNKGQQPDDDWTVEPGAHLQDTEPKPSTNAQRTKLVLLVKDKRGVTDDAQRRVIIGQLVGREIASSKELTLAEAHKAIDALDAEPDHIADAEVVEEQIGTEPNPRNGDTGKPLDPSLFVPSLQSLLIDSRGEGGPTVAASLDGLIAKATTAPELAAIWRVVDEAHKAKHLTAAQFAKLNTLGQAKDRELSGVAQSPNPTAPTGEQVKVASAFADRAGRAKTPDDFNDVYGSLVEARDGGHVTQDQFDALVQMMDDRCRVLFPQQSETAPDGGWSHSHPVARGLAEAGARP